MCNCHPQICVCTLSPASTTKSVAINVGPLPLGYSETRYAHSAPYGSGPTFIATDLVVDAGDNVQTHICG